MTCSGACSRMAFSNALYPPARRYASSERTSCSPRRRNTRYEESISGIWLPLMMNISPHAALIGCQPTFGLIVAFYAFGGRGGFKFRTHGSDAEEIAQIDAACLDDTFGRR